MDKKLSIRCSEDQYKKFNDLSTDLDRSQSETLAYLLENLESNNRDNKFKSHDGEKAGGDISSEIQSLISSSIKAGLEEISLANRDAKTSANHYYGVMEKASEYLQYLDHQLSRTQRIINTDNSDIMTKCTELFQSIKKQMKYMAIFTAMIFALFVSNFFYVNKAGKIEQLSTGKYEGCVSFTHDIHRKVCKLKGEDKRTAELKLLLKCPQ